MQAQAIIYVAAKNAEKREQERRDLNPNFSKDCWTRGSLQKQVDFVDKILNHVNEPEPRLE
jgi:hypothetical protein